MKMPPLIAASVGAELFLSLARGSGHGLTAVLTYAGVFGLVGNLLAIIGDDTAAVNLFTTVDESGICEGDILLLHSPEYNEYEGTVEMAFPEIARQLHMEGKGTQRVDAETYEFTASPDEPIYINNQIFNGEVAISGEGQDVYFSNCEFKANVVSYCPSATKITILPDCEFAEGAHCVLMSGVREADMDYPLPKFVLSFPVEVECPDLGGAIAMGDFDISFDGQSYNMGDAMYVETTDGNIVENDGRLTRADASASAAKGMILA